MIYFVQAEGGPIKIGFTSKADVGRRVAGLQSAHPSPLTILASYHGCVKQEADLHQRFDYARMRGEWFHPVPELLDHIDRMRGTKNPREGSLLGAFLKAHGITDCKGTLPALWALASLVLP